MSVAGSASDLPFEPITASVFEYHCAGCQNTYYGLELAESFDSRLLMRSTIAGSVVLVDCDSAAFQAHYDDVRAYCLRWGLDDVEIAHAANRTFGTRCDRDVDGSRFDAGRDPACTHCGETRVETWRELDPPILINLRVPRATLREWDRRTRSGQRSAFEQQLRAYLREHHADRLPVGDGELP